MKCKYYPDITIAPGCHTGLNSFYLQMRQELYSLNKTRLKSRKGKLLELFRQDFLRESQELAEVQIGYINTQP
ncbi:hypothetical protein Zmor_001014 [Zophobas morio]|uniref:Uncharacterized protein n=1 Tax=Zophobas morio TaxID=2755281 RepID=A0AA38IXN3_9CUCU|nr:hypothetical protein Zmor_001014 [Zophobas morio]